MTLNFMLRDGHLARVAHAARLGMFRELLTYKAIEAGGEVVAVNPRNTSQVCSGYGELLTLTTSPVVVIDLEISPDEETVAIGNFLGPATVWHTATGAVRLTLAGEPDTAVYRVAFHPDGTRLATVGEDNIIRIWGTATGEVIRAWTGHGPPPAGTGSCASTPFCWTIPSPWLMPASPAGGGRKSACNIYIPRNARSGRKRGWVDISLIR